MCFSSSTESKSHSTRSFFTGSASRLASVSARSNDLAARVFGRPLTLRINPFSVARTQ
jgi:hypothetical protein